VLFTQEGPGAKDPGPLDGTTTESLEIGRVAREEEAGTGSDCSREKKSVFLGQFQIQRQVGIRNRQTGTRKFLQGRQCCRPLWAKVVTRFFERERRNEETRPPLGLKLKE
jgi:hypothetical protein